MSEQEQVCPVCRAPGTPVADMIGSFAIQVNCKYCGTYSIEEDALNDLETQPISGSREIANVRGWLREAGPVKLTDKEIELLRDMKTPSVAERAEKLLRLFEKITSSIGSKIGVNSGDYARPWIASSWSIDMEEVKYLLREYMANTKGWIIDVTSLGGGMEFKIAPKGYDYLEELRSGTVDKASGFCAMWFSDEVKAVWIDAISPAIVSAGYNSVRIDNIQHNNKIDDEILANIRSSRFVVADFTGQRGGVYFEAGFALGLGLPVIWTVREDALSQIHFDNRQYNFIVWKPDDLPDFSKRLQARIEATIGKGPVCI